MSPFVGVTMMPEFIQVETVAGVLRRLREAGVTAVATSPYVMEPAPEGAGGREPPIDAGAGKVRLLDRPLWGKRELFVKTAPSFTPTPELYRGLRYQPAPPNELTRRDGPLVGQFIRAAKDAGLKVYLQVQSAIPPGYRVQFGGPVEEDKPRLPDGRTAPVRVDNNASLASEEVNRYTCALLQDLLRAYPEIDGIRVDWPEYPPYTLDSVFFDFSRPAEASARRMGFDFERLRAGSLALYRKLHGGLTDADLEAFLQGDGGRFALLGGAAQYPGFLDLLRFKAMLVDELLAAFRGAVRTGGANKELMPNAFPPPFSVLSGFDFARAARHSSAVSVKLYTMHWPMMARFWGEALLAANRGLSEGLLSAALARGLDLLDGPAPARIADWAYPEPEQPHPAGAAAQARKIRQARTAAGATPVIALAHSYGPLDDFRRRLRVAYEAAGRRVWVNRYGYMSDAKLAALRQIVS